MLSKWKSEEYSIILGWAEKQNMELLFFNQKEKRKGKVKNIYFELF